MIDFWTVLAQNSTQTDIQQTQTLNDYCTFTGYKAESGLTKQEHFNQKVTNYIQQTVEAQRNQDQNNAIEITECVLSTANIIGI
jgi:hypothetical protein